MTHANESICPEVSVIIPTYNRVKLLDRAIKSVLSQTYKDFEIIIVDDCSKKPAEIQQLIGSYQDKRINYIRHESNKGGSAARNTGIRAARGTYVAFLDDDDEWVSNKLEMQMQIYKQSKDKRLGVVYSGITFVNSDKSSSLVIKPQYRGDVQKAVLRACILGSATPIIRRDLFATAGYFDETLPSCQDWDMWIRLSQHCTFDFTSDSLAIAYVHGNQISAGIKNRISARMILLGSYRQTLLKYPEILAAHLERLGLLLMLAGRRRESIGYFYREILVDKLRFRGYVHLILSVVCPNVHIAIIKRFSTFKLGGIQLYY